MAAPSDNNDQQPSLSLDTLELLQNLLEERAELRNLLQLLRDPDLDLDTLLDALEERTPSPDEAVTEPEEGPGDRFPPGENTITFPSPKDPSDIQRPPVAGLPLTPEVRAISGLGNKVDDLRVKTVRTNDLLRTLVSEETSPKASLFWPSDGTFGFLPAGETVVDLVDGEITFKATGDTDPLNTDLDELAASSARSVHIHPFFVKASVTVDPPDDIPGFNRARYMLDPTTTVLRHTPIHELTIFTQLPGAAIITFGEDARNPPVSPVGSVSNMRRIASLTTTDSFTSPVMQPAVFDPRTGTLETMGESDAKEQALLGGTIVHVSFTKQTMWRVENTGQNTARLRLEGAFRPDKTDFQEDVITRPETILDPGDAITLEPERDYIFERLQARSETTGAPTNLNIDMKGLTSLGGG